MSMSYNHSRSYRAGVQRALGQVKLAGVDWTSPNPLRWFEGTEPYADEVSKRIGRGWSSFKGTLPKIGYTALGAGTLYALYKALEHVSTSDGARTYNAPVPPQEGLRDYLESYR